MCEAEILQCQKCRVRFPLYRSCWQRYGTIAPCRGEPGTGVVLRTGAAGAGAVAVTVVGREACGRCYRPEKTQRQQKKQQQPQQQQQQKRATPPRETTRLLDPEGAPDEQSCFPTLRGSRRGSRRAALAAWLRAIVGDDNTRQRQQQRHAAGYLPEKSQTPAVVVDYHEISQTWR
jgi:hypothetical protein